MVEALPGMVVDIEARIDKLEKGLRRANQTQRRAAGQMERRAAQSARKIENTYSRMTANVGASFSKMLGPAMALTGIATLGQLSRKARELAEDYRGVENTLRSLGQTSDEAAEKLAGAAIRSGSDLADMGQTVMRIAKATGDEYDVTVRRVETLNKLLTVGGASAAEVNSVSLQLSQALNSGELAGDELRSLREAAPVELLDAIARAAGGTRAELKQLGADGKLTSDVVLRALDDMAGAADKNFSKMTMTGDRAFTNMRTGLTTFVGRLDEGLGASERFALGLNDLGVFLNDNAGAAEEFGRSVVAAFETADELVADAEAALDSLVQTIRESTIGSVIDLGGAFGDSGLTIGEVLRKIVDGIAMLNGAIGGAAEATREAFLKIPDAISGAMQEAINAVVAGVEAMVNRVLDGIRELAAEIDAWTAKLPRTQGTNLAGSIGTVKLGRVTDLGTDYSSRSLADAYREGFQRDEQAVLDAVSGIQDALAGALDDVKGRYKENRRRLAEQNAARERETPAPTDPDSGAGGSAGGAGGGRKGAGAAQKLDDFERAVQSITQRTAALAAEATALDQAAQAGQRYGDAREYARAKAELLVAAQRAGLQITPQLSAHMDQLARAYVDAGLAAEDAAERMAEIEGAGEQGRSALESMFGSILDGSKTAGEAIADLVLELLKMQALKMIMGIPGMDTAATFLGVGFVRGGFTGHGGKYEPAGIVHRGEYVMPKEVVRRVGVDTLAGLHQRALQGYSDGGLVGDSRNATRALGGAPRGSGESMGSVTINAPVTVNATGGTPEQNHDLAKQMGREMEVTMRNVVLSELQRQMRPGGMIGAR